MTTRAFPTVLRQIARTGRHMARRLATAGLDLVLPPTCLLCREVTAAPGALCAGCWGRINFLSGSLCTCCGRPFELAVPAGTSCGACLARPPRFARARAVFEYHGGGRELVLALKHGDRLDLVPPLARWLAGVGRELLDEADLIVPVPLHWRRRLARRFNQSEELAFTLGALVECPVATDLLRRSRATPTQGGLGRQARRRNVAAAFRAVGGERLAGRRILLIDDVLTTGATVEACTRALKRGGAAAIDVLTLARVTIAGDGG